MKTPKEILLHRHQDMELKLNAVRHRALAAVNRRPWQEFLRAARWHLAGMGAVWMVILFLTFDAPSSLGVATARAQIPPARVLLEAVLQNQRDLIELTETPPAVEPAVPPPRRSENRSSTAMV